MTTASERSEETAREHRRCESEGRDREAARNLLLLAPDIQEEVLALEYPAGREPITERTLRRRLESLVWEDQRALWAELRAVAGQVRGGGPRSPFPSPLPLHSALIRPNPTKPD